MEIIMVYCVEDDASIRDLMVYTLNASGFDALGFSAGAPFWARIGKELPELVILDIMLPGEDGIAILKKLRSSPNTSDIQIIMATAKGSEYDKVIGLDSGTDERWLTYLTQTDKAPEAIRLRARAFFHAYSGPGRTFLLLS